MAYFWTAFDWGAYLRDTTRLTLAQHGAYILLMAEYYQTGNPLPANASDLLRVCRAFDEEDKKAMLFVLDKYFIKDGDLYRHKRIDQELLKASQVSEKRSIAGKRGVESKRKNKEANALANGQASVVANASTVTVTVTDTKPTTPLPPKRGRRSREELISAYSDGTREVVNWCLHNWSKKRKGNQSLIIPKVPKLASRIDQALKTPNVTPSLLIEGAKIYLSEPNDWVQAPEYYFGPGKDGEATWKSYSRMAYHNNHKSLSVAAGVTQ